MRTIRFTISLSYLERQLLRAIAEKLQRSQGDTLRILMYRAADDFGIDDEDLITSASLIQEEANE